MKYSSPPSRRVIFAGVSLIAACGTPAVGYKEPQLGGPTATVTFISKARNGANLAVIRVLGDPDGCNCSQEPTEIIGILHNKVLIPGSSSFADKGKDVDTFSVVFPANGTPLRLLLGSPGYAVNFSYSPRAGVPARTVQTSYCQAHESFIPVAGGQYEVVFDPYKSACGFEISRTADSSSVSVSKKEYPPCSMWPGATEGIAGMVLKLCKANPDWYERPSL